MAEEYANGISPPPRPALYAKLPDNAPRKYQILRFWDVMEPSDPTKLSWTKIGVAFSTMFTIITSGATALQHFISTTAQTDWIWMASAIGLHTVTKGAHEMKRITERVQ